MESAIFNSMGMAGCDPAIIFIILLVLIIILLVMIIVQMVSLSKLKKNYNRFMQGKDGESLEDEMHKLFDDMRIMKKASEKADYEISGIKKNLLFAYQKLGIVRYDAFREMGGKLSFSIALLNDNDDGFIMNSVHSSDGCYTYIKEIKGGKAAVVLGEEESEALGMALSSITNEKNARKYDGNVEDRNINFKEKSKEKNPFKAPEVELDIEPLDLEELGFEEV